MTREPEIQGPIYTCRSAVTKVEGLHRQAFLDTGEQVQFGVHGPLVDYYKLPAQVPFPFPVDYIVAAAGG